MLRLIALLLLALPAALSAQAVVQNPSTRVELIAGAPDASGARTVGIVLTPKPGWHSYWSNPGEAGFAPKATWTLPAGATAAPLRFPVPGTLLVSGLMNYVYEKPTTLLTTVAGPAGPIGLDLNYLVCTAEMCVPESAKLTLRRRCRARPARRRGGRRPARPSGRRALRRRPRPPRARRTGARPGERHPRVLLPRR